ncbi:MAG: polysaccharide deacetylase family protein [Peptostreptococcaceae bacterium]
MKRKLGVVLGVLFVAFMIYSLRNNNLKSQEVVKLNKSNDITRDYEDIIIKKGNTEEKVVALTFDDGPDEDFTPQILDILKKHDVKATFFLIGEKVGYHPEIVKREIEEGHEVGNHTFTHINVAKRGYDDIYNEVTKTQEAIKKVTGEEPTLFRPPYRAISKNMCDIVKNKNMSIVLWSNLDPRDWSNPGVYYIVNTIDTKVENGNIILLHDYNNLRNSKSQTIQALDSVITNLKSKGYKFVTISELIDHLDKKDQQTQN